MNRRQKNTIDKIRRRHQELVHLLLKLMTKLESKRAMGLSLHTQEIDFRRQLESLKRKLAKPAQYQARVSELQSIVHMQEDRSGGFGADGLNYKLDGFNQQQLYDFLDWQRNALQLLTSTLVKDKQIMDTLIQQLEKTSYYTTSSPSTTSAIQTFSSTYPYDPFSSMTTSSSKSTYSNFPYAL